MHDTSPALSVILGTNEIASAVAVHLRRGGLDVVLSHDPFPPVIRRGMAFHDVLFGDRRVIENIEGLRVDNAGEIAGSLADPDHVAVTALRPVDLTTMRRLDVLIDARMQKHRVTRDLRGIARVTVGLGPNFHVGMNCDVAVETRPARNGHVVATGATDAADGISSRLGGIGRERFVYSDRPGRWHTPVDIGIRTDAHAVVGYLGSQPVRSPFAGIVRGIARDGAQVPKGVKLVEIDPRGSQARWTGIDDRGRGIAEAAVRAIRLRSRQLAAATAIDAAFAL